VATSAWPGGKDNLTPIDLASTAMDVVGEEHDEKHELTEDFINKAQDDIGTTTPAAGSLRYKVQNTSGGHIHDGVDSRGLTAAQFVGTRLNGAPAAPSMTGPQKVFNFSDTADITWGITTQGASDQFTIKANLANPPSVISVRSPAYAVVYRTGSTYFAIDYAGGDLGSGANPVTVINAATLACEAAGGGDVHCVAAKYVWTGTAAIQARDGVRLKGEGGRMVTSGTSVSYGTVFQPSANMPAFVDATTGRAFVVEGITFDGLTFNLTNAFVVLSDLSQAVRRCRFMKGSGTVNQVKLAGSGIGNMRVEDSDFDNFHKGIWVQLSDCEVRGNHLEGANGGADTAGVYLDAGGGGCIIMDNHMTCYGNSSTRDISVNAQNAHILGNYLDTTGSANVEVTGAGQLTKIVGNHIKCSDLVSGGHIDGVLVGSALCTSGGLTVTGNTWQKHSGTGRAFDHFVHFASQPNRIIVRENHGGSLNGGGTVTNAASFASGAQYFEGANAEGITGH